MIDKWRRRDWPAQTVIECEGCDTTGTTTRGPNGLPPEWVGCGRSRKKPGRHARWCPRCHASNAIARYDNPTPSEVKRLIETKVSA